MKTSEVIAKLEKVLEGTGVEIVGVGSVQKIPYDAFTASELGLSHATTYRTATVTLAIAED